MRMDSQGIETSVHIQVVAEDGFAEAEWIQAVADDNPEWLMVQMVFCDLFSEDLERHQRLSTVLEVRQIVSRALTEDARTGANALLDNARFTKEPRAVEERALSFDLQLIPEPMEKTAMIMEAAPGTSVALCHTGSPRDRSPDELIDWGGTPSLIVASSPDGVQTLQSRYV